MDHKGGAHFPADGAWGGIRNTMLTPESTDAICEIVRHGNYITTACRVLQIGIRTVTRWMSLGRQAVEEGREDMYSVFYLRVKEAEACAEIYAVEAWRSHLDRDWRACKDYLARRFPDRWADQRRVTIGVEREMDHMFRELEQKLPADLFAIVVRELQDMQRDDDVESDD